MNEQREILNSTQLEIIIKRLSQELIESHQDFSSSVIVSLQPRGKYLANRLISCLSENFNLTSIASGDLDISPKWSVGASSGYDLKNNGITYTQLRFERDLLSWRMNFSWIPFSSNAQWNFFIGIKSGILGDIKYDKRRQRDKQL